MNLDDERAIMAGLCAEEEDVELIGAAHAEYVSFLCSSLSPSLVLMLL